MTDKLSKMQVEALKISAMPFEDRPRLWSPPAATWRSLRKRRLISTAPWQITEKGREALAALGE